VSQTFLENSIKTHSSIQRCISCTNRRRNPEKIIQPTFCKTFQMSQSYILMITVIYHCHKYARVGMLTTDCHCFLCEIFLPANTMYTTIPHTITVILKCTQLCKLLKPNYKCYMHFNGCICHLFS